MALSSTVLGPVDLANAPDTVAGWLEESKLARQAVIWPALAHLDWKKAGIEVEARAARATDLVGITGAFCAIAETGTLMLLSGADTPATVSLLPETHVALVDVRRVVAHMEDGFDLLRRERGAAPRAINFVSGPRAPPTSSRPSRSARMAPIAWRSSWLSEVTPPWPAERDAESAQTDRAQRKGRQAPEHYSSW